MKMNKISWLSAAALALFLCACVTFTTDAYRTLVVSQQSYDATLSAMGDLYREGKITEAQKDEAIKIGRAYKLAHNGAVASLAKYEETKQEADKNAYAQAASTASAALAKLIAYCRPFIEKGVK